MCVCVCVCVLKVVELPLKLLRQFTNNVFYCIAMRYDATVNALTTHFYILSRIFLYIIGCRVNFCNLNLRRFKTF